MSVQVSLNFPDFAAAQAFFASQQSVSVQVASDLKDALVPQPTEVQPPVATAEAPRRGRKPKAPEAVAPLDVKNGDPLPENMQPAKPAESPVDPLEVPAFLDRREKPDEAPPAKVWTIDEVRDELKKVSEKHGIDAVRAIVVEAGGTSRISEVPAEKYGAVVEAAQKKLAA